MLKANRNIGSAGAANYALDILRQGQIEPTELVSGKSVVPGIHFVMDPDSDFTANYRSPRGRLLEIECQTARAGRWFGLHVALDAADMRAFSIAGLAIRATAERAHAMTAALRSADREGFSDTFFPKAVAVQYEPVTHLDVIEIDRCDELPEVAPWREVVLFLPTSSFRLCLHDLRLFVA